MKGGGLQRLNIIQLEDNDRECCECIVDDVIKKVKESLMSENENGYYIKSVIFAEDAKEKMINYILNSKIDKGRAKDKLLMTIKSTARLEKDDIFGKDSVKIITTDSNRETDDDKEVVLYFKMPEADEDYIDKSSESKADISKVLTDSVHPFIESVRQLIESAESSFESTQSLSESTQESPLASAQKSLALAEQYIKSAQQLFAKAQKFPVSARVFEESAKLLINPIKSAIGKAQQSLKQGSFSKWERPFIDSAQQLLESAQQSLKKATQDQQSESEEEINGSTGGEIPESSRDDGSGVNDVQVLGNQASDVSKEHIEEEIQSVNSDKESEELQGSFSKREQPFNDAQVLGNQASDVSKEHIEEEIQSVKSDKESEELRKKITSKFKDSDCCKKLLLKLDEKDALRRYNSRITYVKRFDVIETIREELKENNGSDANKLSKTAREELLLQLDKKKEELCAKLDESKQKLIEGMREQIGAKEDFSLECIPKILEDVPQKHIGIANVDNSSCYLNSVIQQLYRDPEFRNFLSGLRNKEKVTELKAKKDNNFVIYYNLMKIFETIDNIADGSKVKGKEFEGYVNVIRYILYDIEYSNQQDAQEFLNFIFDRLGFVSGLQTMLVTAEGQPISGFDRDVQILILPLSQSTAVQNCCSDYFAKNEKEVLEDKSIECKREIKCLPQTLWLSLDRVSDSGKKITKEINLDATIDLSDFYNGSVKKSEYELTGVIKHIGESTYGGHYTSYVRDGNKWFLLDDSEDPQIISTIDTEELKRNAYILRYERVNKKPSDD